MLRKSAIGFWLLVCCVFSSCAFPQTQRQVAITIDDLPYTDELHCREKEASATIKKLLGPIRSESVPVVGFVVGVRCGNLNLEQRRGLLKMWLDAGVELGNHTWSHPDLNRVSLEEYERQILATDDDLHRAFRPLQLKYFRAPYLHNGRTIETKKQLQSFLSRHGYREAPVTFDNNDWRFAAAYSRALKTNNTGLARAIEDAYLPYMGEIIAFFEKRSVEVLGRECPQVLLLHASRLNADAMPRLLRMLRERGYAFVSLEQALSDEAYRLPDTYTGPKGLSWIHRWGLTNGKPIQMEPEEPDWVKSAAGQPRP